MFSTKALPCTCPVLFPSAVDQIVLAVRQAKKLVQRLALLHILCKASALCTAICPGRTVCKNCLILQHQFPNARPHVCVSRTSDAAFHLAESCLQLCQYQRLQLTLRSLLCRLSNRYAHKAPICHHHFVSITNADVEAIHKASLTSAAGTPTLPQSPCSVHSTTSEEQQH